MRETSHCPRCDSELPPDAPAGLCPQCLLKQGREAGSGAESGQSDLPPTTPTASRFVPPQLEELAPLFPNLEILELLGKGGMGAVYKARQPHLDRFVALKILPPEVGEDPAFQERFTREARALAKLNHPHIVAVYDFGQAAARSVRVSDPAGPEHGSSPVLGEPSGQAGGSVGDRPQRKDGQLYYFLMEYVDGANVRQLIQQGGLTPVEALAIVPQICEALQYAHDEGIVHRDIKPENILVDKKGRAKIADFGLAKLVGKTPEGVTLTGTQQVMGTLHYMAPEQMKGSRAVDHRADIYALGVVFYEMLTGELPIGKFEPPSRKVQVDVRLDEVVLRALENEPERRYQKASEVKTDVEAISSSLRTVGVPPPAPESERSESESSSGQEPPNASISRPLLLDQAIGLAAGWLSGVLAMFCAGLIATGLITAWHYATLGRWGGPALEIDPRFAWLRWPLVALGLFMAGLGVAGLWRIIQFWRSSDDTDIGAGTAGRRASAQKSAAAESHSDSEGGASGGTRGLARGTANSSSKQGSLTTKRTRVLCVGGIVVLLIALAIGFVLVRDRWLISAVSSGEIERARILLNLAADPDACDDHGRTPLPWPSPTMIWPWSSCS